MRKWKLGGLLVALALVGAACNVVVTPTATNGWFFSNDGLPNGSGVYMNGPGTPPAGRGSALLTIDAGGREMIASNDYANISLSSFSRLEYSTYQLTPNATGGAPNLAFDTDFDKSDNSTAYQGRLVFVPEANGGVDTPGVWQTWNTITAGGWYTSGTGSSTYGPIVGGSREANPPCTQTSFCTWAQVMNHYPNARILPSTGLLVLRVGGNTHAGSAAVDNLVVGIGSQAQFTNFEPGDGHIAVTSSNATSLGFGFVQETSTGSGSFVTGPNGADGSGSAQLKVDSTGGEALATGVFAGTRFDQLTFLSYKTYMAAAGSNAPTLQFDADYDSTDPNTTYQGRVVFEPSLSGGAPVTSETWQTWNPLTASSGWWQTGTPIVNNISGTAICTQAAPCSLQTLLATYPDLQIRPITGQSGGIPTAGGIWMKAGGGWSGGFTGNIDSLTVGVKNGTVNGTVTYDLGG